MSVTNPGGRLPGTLVPRGCNSHRTMTDLVLTAVAWTSQCQHLRFLMEIEESFSAHNALHNRAGPVANGLALTPTTNNTK